MKKAVFAAGCFWGVESIFAKVPGVLSTEVGYMGGHYPQPNYKDVCTGKTGHAEVVKVEFDPLVISYRELLNVFWNCHNPTTLNRQGPDWGSQYRSAIFYFDAQQFEDAKESKEKLLSSKQYADSIVTEIVPAQTFFRGEEYHQKYHEKHGGGCKIFNEDKRLE